MRKDRDSTTRTPARAPQPPLQASISGLTLIEVLIALLVLSIGLVGMASLQLNSLKSAHSSYYRSLASAAALDTEERLWLEMQRTILGDPSSSPFCMDKEDIDKVISDSQNAWRPSEEGGVNMAGIPALTVSATTDGSILTSQSREDTSNTGTWTYRWQEIPIRLTWTENRFGEGADQGFTESFDYVARIPCVAEWDDGSST